MTWVLYVYYASIALAVLLVAASGMGAFGLDLDHDGHPDMDDDHGGFLSILGIGKAPFSILTMSYLLSFGVAGVLFVLVGAWLPGYELYSFVFALVFSVVFTAVFARILGRFIPTVETYTKQKEDLIGCQGTVVTRVSSTSGSADIKDSDGSLHRIPAVTISGEITRGEKILVVGCNENSTFVVEQLPN